MMLQTLWFFLIYLRITSHVSHAIDSAAATAEEDIDSVDTSAEIAPHEINTVNALGHILKADSPELPGSDRSDVALQEELAQLHEPDFLLIGVVKSGSTSLYHYLMQHPEVSGVESTFLLPNDIRHQIQEIMRKRRAGLLPKTNGASPPHQNKEEGEIKHEAVRISPGNFVKKSIYDINNFDLARMIKPIIDQKEIRFFDSFWYNHLQTVSNHSLLTAWKWYLNVFNQEEVAPGAQLLRGEASPTYFASSQFTAERIKLWLPNVKLILLLRNPVRRFVSHLKMIKENHASNLRFRKQREMEVKNNRNRTVLTDNNNNNGAARRLLQQMGYNPPWGNPLNNPYNEAPAMNAMRSFVPNTRYGRKPNRQRMKRGKGMRPFVRTRAQMRNSGVDWSGFDDDDDGVDGGELTEEVMGHDDDEYINQEASMYEEQRQSLLRQRRERRDEWREKRMTPPQAKGQRKKSKKPVNKMEKIIGTIYKLSMYQVILVSNANPDSHDFYGKRWGIGRDVTGFINRLLFGGIYTMRMREWLKRFDADHLFYRESSELFNNPVRLMEELETFLGVTPLGEEAWKNITNKVYNVELERGKGYQHKVQDTQDIAHWDIDQEKETQIMHPSEERKWQSQEIISLLKGYYKPHNQQLAQLFDGVQYDGWDYVDT